MQNGIFPAKKIYVASCSVPRIYFPQSSNFTSIRKNIQSEDNPKNCVNSAMEKDKYIRLAILFCLPAVVQTIMNYSNAFSLAFAS